MSSEVAPCTEKRMTMAPVAIPSGDVMANSAAAFRTPLVETEFCGTYVRRSSEISNNTKY